MPAADEEGVSGVPGAVQADGMGGCGCGWAVLAAFMVLLSAEEEGEGSADDEAEVRDGAGRMLPRLLLRRIMPPAPKPPIPPKPPNPLPVPEPETAVAARV